MTVMTSCNLYPKTHPTATLCYEGSQWTGELEVGQGQKVIKGQGQKVINQRVDN